MDESETTGNELDHKMVVFLYGAERVTAPAWLFRALLVAGADVTEIQPY